VRYIVHMGPIKTGSSYIQNKLIEIREQLLAEGICVPNEWRNFDWRNHSGLSFQLREGLADDVARTFEKINQGNFHTVVISDEGLYNLKPHQLRLLKKVAGSGADLEFVYYCRRWSDRLPSIWNQAVRAGGRETLKEFLDRHVSSPRKINLDYTMSWERYEAVFGRRALRIICFDHLRESRADLADHFLKQVVGFHQPVALEEGRLVNASTSPEDTEMIRVLNGIRWERAEVSDGKLAKRFLRKRHALSDVPKLSEVIAHSTTTLQFSDSHPGLEDVYARVNAWADCSPNAAEGRLFERRSRELPFVDPAYLSRPGMRRLYAGILSELGDRVLKARPSNKERWDRQQHNSALPEYLRHEQSLKTEAPG